MLATIPKGHGFKATNHGTYATRGGVVTHICYSGATWVLLDPATYGKHMVTRCVYDPFDLEGELELDWKDPWQLIELIQYADTRVDIITSLIRLSAKTFLRLNTSGCSSEFTELTYAWCIISWIAKLDVLDERYSEYGIIRQSLEVMMKHHGKTWKRIHAGWLASRWSKDHPLLAIFNKHIRPTL